MNRSTKHPTLDGIIPHVCVSGSRRLVLIRILSLHMHVVQFFFYFTKMTDVVCYYHAGYSCGDVVADVWMRGRRGPKRRSVCTTCLVWFESNQLADRYSENAAGANLLPVPPHKACFYAANRNMSSCEQHACGVVHMLGRSTKKKYRNVCGTCQSWLTEGGLAVLSNEAIHADGAREDGVYRQSWLFDVILV